MIIAAGAAFGLSNGETIYQGVKVAGTDVGALTVAQAEERLSGKATEASAAPVTLKCVDTSVRATAAELGATIDIKASVKAAFDVGREGTLMHRIARIVEVRQNGIDLPVVHTLDREVAQSFLNSLAEKIDRKPADAKLEVKKGSFRITKEKTGLKLDVERSLSGIEEQIGLVPKEIDLVAVTDEPKVTAEGFKGIDGVISSYSTRFKPRQVDRTHNLGLAVKSIDGTLVKPGGTFSYNREVGPREKKYGFRDAPIFVKGEVEPGTGGGICQVSTTLYNAALLANLKIIQRQHHSRPVTYAPVGRDATVAFPSLDLRFQNTTGYPLYVSAYMGKNTVNVALLGKKTPGLKVQIVSADHKVIPMPVIKRPASDAPVEKSERGMSGHKITIYRVVTLNGGETRRERVSTDVYRPQPRIIHAPKPKPAVQAATPAPATVGM